MCYATLQACNNGPNGCGGTGLFASCILCARRRIHSCHTTVTSLRRRPLKGTSLRARPSAPRFAPRNPNICSTGAAGGSDYNYACPADFVQPSGQLALANGAGTSCFTSYDACMTSSSVCGNARFLGSVLANIIPGFSPIATELKCVVDFSSCTTGMSGGNPGTVYTCPYDKSRFALPNGAGSYCYASFSDCLSSSTNVRSGASQPSLTACS